MLRQFLVATFPDEHALKEAARRLRARGFRIHDVYAPYAVHGLDEIMGIRRSRLPLAALLAGAAGLAVAIGFQFYAAVFDWPINVGGKPLNSTLAFVPITFEITVLSAGLAAATAFLARCRLFPGAHREAPAEGVTEDAFALTVRRREATFDAGECRRLLLESGARNVFLQEPAS